jgi:hypothetical protein
MADTKKRQKSRRLKKRLDLKDDLTDDEDAITSRRSRKNKNDPVEQTPQTSSGQQKGRGDTSDEEVSGATVNYIFCFSFAIRRKDGQRTPQTQKE